MMAFFWQDALLLSFVAAVVVHADMKLECRPDHVSLVWTERRSQADTSLFRLGNCAPTSVTAREAVFNVDFDECNFRKLVTGDQLVYSNDLTSPDYQVQSLIPQVVCTFERPADWQPPIYDPVFNTYGEGDLVFRMGLTNDDFQGPATSNRFPLGSILHIMASVEQNRHQPLLLLLEECVAANAPEIQPETNLYPIITNKGCLVDSKTSRSKFEERQKSSEIRMSLQAFKFAHGEEVFIHCKMVAWDPSSLDDTKKACHYNKEHGWELLDNIAYSNLCNCCETSCQSQKTRSTRSVKHGVTQMAVIGPVKVTD